MESSVFRAGFGLGIVLLLVGACSTSTTPVGHSADAGGVQAQGSDAASEPVGPRVPTSIFKEGLPDSGKYCALITAAECDGNEDCPPGKYCCGTRSDSLSYKSVKCEDTCDESTNPSVSMICHEGDACPLRADASVPDGSAPQCVRSIVLPSYLGRCATPSPLTPKGFIGQPKAAGKVNCGPTLVCGSGEKCCLLVTWDAATQSSVFGDGHCAKVADECTCPATAP